MKTAMSNQELNTYYDKAREKYYECIKNEENIFLEHEISTSPALIKLQPLSIKICFFQEITNKYQVEISLSLLDNSTLPIGKYVYIEDENGNSVEDSLIFF